ncbi:MAG: hypothetical protein NT040_14680 [Bacteroidetes bacterium]|nr:hypothetical protein [Bacteroidota bacterium]
MKNVNVIVAMVILSLTGLLAGCAKDSGTTPENVTRAAFIGKWSVKPTTKLTYEVTISADPNSSNGVFISNFALIGTSYPPASAEVNGSSIVLDAGQIIGGGITINGSGTLSGTHIIWKYTTFDGADLTNVYETYTKE